MCSLSALAGGSLQTGARWWQKRWQKRWQLLHQPLWCPQPCSVGDPRRGERGLCHFPSFSSAVRPLARARWGLVLGGRSFGEAAVRQLCASLVRPSFPEIKLFQTKYELSDLGRACKLLVRAGKVFTRQSALSQYPPSPWDLQHSRPPLCRPTRRGVFTLFQTKQCKVLTFLYHSLLLE